jgi:K+-transporting ATPase ATPase C chain
MLSTLKPAALLLICLSVLTGIIYPLTITLTAQLAFPTQANGSLINSDNKIIGSTLIGQQFTKDHYFWGRPSATSPAYNGAASGGSNLSVTNPALTKAIKQRVELLGNHHKNLIPIDLVTRSASGLDPDISPSAAYFQVERVAQARHISQKKLNELIAQHINGRQWGILGEERVNVLALNLALDKQ